MFLLSKLKNIRNKPESTRKKALWVMVFVCMIIVSGVWVYTFSQRKKNATNLLNLNMSEYPNYNSQVKKYNDLEKEKQEALSKAAFEFEKADAEAQAIKYLEDNKILNEIGQDNITIAEAEKTNDMWKLAFKQLYEKIPVELSEISFTVGKDKAINLEKSVYYPGIDLDISPKLTQDKIFDLIKNSIKGDPIMKNSELVIYTLESKNKTEQRLAWKISVSEGDPISEVIYYADAESGKILGTNKQ